MEPVSIVIYLRINRTLRHQEFLHYVFKTDSKSFSSTEVASGPIIFQDVLYWSTWIHKIIIQKYMGTRSIIRRYPFYHLKSWSEHQNRCQLLLSRMILDYSLRNESVMLISLPKSGVIIFIHFIYTFCTFFHLHFLSFALHMVVPLSWFTGLQQWVAQCFVALRWRSARERLYFSTGCIICTPIRDCSGAYRGCGYKCIRTAGT